MWMQTVFFFNVHVVCLSVRVCSSRKQIAHTLALALTLTILLPALVFHPRFLPDQITLTLVPRA